MVNVMLKWGSTMVLPQLEDVFGQLVPPLQAGFMKGRDMYHNLHHCRSYWDSMPEGFLLSVDFEKAYNTITFEHAQVMFHLMGLRAGMIALMVQLFQSLVAFGLQGVIIVDVLWSPRAGIRQGDPFSPALFVPLASVIIAVLQIVHPDPHVRMYADDLVMYISCSSADAKILLQDMVHALNTFRLHTGLRMNGSKSKVLLKGLDPQQFVQSLGLKFALKIKYLGVMIGPVTEKDTCTSAVSKSFIRAQIVRHLDLTRFEKVQLLKVWIYPLWVLPARVSYPSKQIIQHMCTTLHQALGIDSWGLTLKEFGHSFQRGGGLI